MRTASHFAVGLGKGEKVRGAQNPVKPKLAGCGMEAFASATRTVDSPPVTKRRVGILTHHELESLAQQRAIHAPVPFAPDQVQPTSLDLRLGPIAYRIRAGFLPRTEPVSERLRDLCLYTLDLEQGAVLERGCIYLVPLLETLGLPPDVSGRCNPKSSTGRIDLFTRVITDCHERFDDIRAGYHGRLFLEIMPRSFPVRVQTGLRLNQIRLLRGKTRLDDGETTHEHEASALVTDAHGGAFAAGSLRIDGGFHLAVSLVPDPGTEIIGYRAKGYTGVVDLASIGTHDPLAFFEPLAATASRRLLLEPEEFYIFQSRERVRVPLHLAAEMHAYDVGIGELRTNYAGFFDAGFGHGGDGALRGTPAVLEVRPHDVPFVIEDGQVLFRLEFHRTLMRCERWYGGPGSSSNYARQGLTLAKYFRA